MAKMTVRMMVDELTAEQLIRLKQLLPQLESIITYKAKGGGRGNIEGLAKHLVKVLGNDPHLHTKCMAADELAEYSEDRRAAICARVHYIATGMWPGEHGGKNPKGPEKKEASLDDQLGRIRTLLNGAINPPSNKIDSAPYEYIEQIYPTYFICNKNGEYYKISYSIDPETDAVTLGERVEVMRAWTEKEIDNGDTKIRGHMRFKGGD